MEYEWLLFVFLLAIVVELWMLVSMVGSLISAMISVAAEAKNKEAMDLTDEWFIREYNRRFSNVRDNK